MGAARATSIRESPVVSDVIYVCDGPGLHTEITNYERVN